MVVPDDRRMDRASTKVVIQPEESPPVVWLGRSVEPAVGDSARGELTNEEAAMRTLLKFQIAVEAGNEAVRSGKVAQVNQALMARVQPEAVYFFTENGKRTGFVVFDLEDPSQIPLIAEPLFQEFNATVEFFPVMNADDLQKAITALAQGQ